MFYNLFASTCLVFIEPMRAMRKRCNNCALGIVFKGKKRKFWLLQQLGSLNFNSYRFLKVPKMQSNFFWCEYRNRKKSILLSAFFTQLFLYFYQNKVFQIFSILSNSCNHNENIWSTANDTFVTSEPPKYSWFIFVTKFLFWFFLMILWHNYFFLLKPINVDFGQPITQTALPCSTFDQAKKIVKKRI